MKPFVHKNFIGDFFDILEGKKLRENDLFVSGGNRQRDAVASVLSGQVGIKEIPALTAALKDLNISLVKLIVLDMSRITAFSRNAVGLLVNYLYSVEGRGKRMILYRPSPVVIDALQSLSLTYLFEILETEEELLLALPD